ncbi:calcium-binding protein [Pontivivens ytuae]|uniref:Calcium-binding protein n=1 Tax=Pontivivens ytuae TaxID=2789856 RepID=A0A7S9QBZ4_9RHOB|nr:calcium-binding protein [Pontivivens ytuae]QPH53393.1 calcium-binding protein [Pontivivens ytuae]
MSIDFNGTSGDDTLIGTAAREFIRGFAGNDLISGDLGLDTLDGGNGTDTVSFEYTSADVDIDLVAELATFFNGNTEEIRNFENVIGSGGDNLITGDSGANDLQGGAGDDTISGGLGRDTMDGGDGIDTIDFSYTSADVDIDLAAGLATFFNGVTEVITNFENAIGTSGDNEITGTDGDNILDGNGGDDTLNGGAGNDTLIGSEDGFTEYNGGFGIDTIDFSASTSDLIVDLELDEIFRLEADGRMTSIGDPVGNFNVLTGAGDDLILSRDDTFIDAGAGNDFINGEFGGSDTMLGGSGDDILSNRLGTGNDFMFGGSGNDEFRIAGEANFAFGEEGNDTLRGEDDFFIGVDALDGGDGDDVLFGGGGNDLLTGGEGSDTFEFNDASHRDTVTDFTAGEDVLVFDVDNPADFEIVQFDGSTIITNETAVPFADEVSVTLLGFTGTLTADDLSFV